MDSGFLLHAPHRAMTHAAGEDEAKSSAPNNAGPRVARAQAASRTAALALLHAYLMGGSEAPQANIEEQPVIAGDPYAIPFMACITFVRLRNGILVINRGVVKKARILVLVQHAEALQWPAGRTLGQGAMQSRTAGACCR